jgi:Flp pilus assembly protein TadB
MIVPLTFGAVLGAGLWCLVLAVVPNRAPLGAVIARLHRPAASPTTQRTLGSRLLARLGDQRVRTGVTTADLAVLDRPIEVHASHLALAALAGAAAPLTLIAMLRAGGVGVGWIIPVWAVVLGVAAGAGLVVINVRESAASERAALRYQLGAYLDVLAMLLAAGESDEQALQLAARAGDARLFRGLQRSYRDAAISGQPMLTGMRRLGDRWGIVELVEIADAGSLAASDGAAVRRTLTAKAHAMRNAQLAAEETDARLRSNRLGFPQVLLAIAFIVMILYPAFAGLLTDLNQ